MKLILRDLESTRVRIGQDFSIISALFYVVFAVFRMLRRQGAMGKKVTSAIDRARSTLSGINVTITGISCWTNRTWKYSNRAQRYPTLL